MATRRKPKPKQPRYKSAEEETNSIAQELKTAQVTPMTLERAKSETVKLTEQLDNLVESINHWRGQVSYHTTEASRAKDALTQATLNHAELKAKLAVAVDPPKLVV